VSFVVWQGGTTKTYLSVLSTPRHQQDSTEPSSNNWIGSCWLWSLLITNGVVPELSWKVVKVQWLCFFFSPSPPLHTKNSWYGDSKWLKSWLLDQPQLLRHHGILLVSTELLYCPNHVLKCLFHVFSVVGLGQFSGAVARWCLGGSKHKITSTVQCYLITCCSLHIYLLFSGEAVLVVCCLRGCSIVCFCVCMADDSFY
jgi:hypothetical protein